MNPQRSFVLHPEAARDIAEIWGFIAADNLPAAARVRAEILSAIRELTSSPHMGHSRPDLTSQELRFWNVREYLIAYAPDEDPVVVLAVIHGRLSPRVMAALLRSRE